MSCFKKCFKTNIFARHRSCTICAYSPASQREQAPIFRGGGQSGNSVARGLFNIEINDINLGLLVEVWNKGVIWDRALGYHYLPLTSVAYDEQECGGRWVELEAQLMMRGGAVVGTTGPTGHALLLDCRFEPPFGMYFIHYRPIYFDELWHVATGPDYVDFLCSSAEMRMEKNGIAD
ncbi:putative unc-13 [Danaus plexippus plexippus]|uniref:Unc-13 n=1 Tax=Danaus plexippus plexippus TaxID=278856 RepID=A0A212F308_DANPL|nr:putative unc-13 [Danaus plexippus plexippus]